MLYKARMLHKLDCIRTSDEEDFSINTVYTLSERQLKLLYIVENNKIYSIDRMSISKRIDVTQLFTDVTVAKLLLKLTFSDEEYICFILY